MPDIDLNLQESDWRGTLTGEMLLLGLLGKLLYQQPRQNWIRSLLDEEVFEEAPLPLHDPDAMQGLALIKDWSQRAKDGFGEQDFDLICSDYTRLFIGPGKVLAPPWESVYFNDERLTFQKETLQVRDWYRRFGLKSKRLHNEPDDHIGLELMFLAHLARLGLQALEEQNEVRFAATVAAQCDFLASHPLRWVPNWAKLVVEKARTDFYRGVALLTKGALVEVDGMLRVYFSERLK